MAQFTFALLLEICHRTAHHSDAVFRGRWAEKRDFSFWDYPLIELSGKTLGIIGFGRIGRAVGEIARAFGMDVIAVDDQACDEGRRIASYVPLDELFTRADVISLHCPLFPATLGIINRESIARMKDGVIILNTARGPLIKEADLAYALKSGKVYAALSCCNDPAMADRCTVKGADKAIWSIKASASLNSDCAVLLREGFRAGKIRLLVTEYDAEERLSELKGYSSLNPAEKLGIQMPYIHTTLLINELVRLLHDETGGKVKVYERSGMRKDRYSSLSYNYYVAIQLENKLARRNSSGVVNEERFMYRAPKIK